MDSSTLLDDKDSATMVKHLLHQIQKLMNTSNKFINVQRKRRLVQFFFFQLILFFYNAKMQMLQCKIIELSIIILRLIIYLLTHHSIYS